ncbi:MAG: hypothetical protein F6K30_17195 [Cyanothece sp. SIO2G6]|nr:hypothetical protein [Cyanothece sp. SIO2G6]
MSAVQVLSWQSVVLFGLAIWLSCSVLLDVVIMPSLYMTRMMEQPGFAAAGYSIFWVFNRIELVFAALVLTGVLALYFLLQPTHPIGRGAIALAVFLVAIPLIYTYALMPHMSALGLDLSPFSLSDQLATSMAQLHRDYFGLEIFKLALGGSLFGLCYRLAGTESN